jgi:hypothetical protein
MKGEINEALLLGMETHFPPNLVELRKHNQYLAMRIKEKNVCLFKLKTKVDFQEYSKT